MTNKADYARNRRLTDPEYAERERAYNRKYYREKRREKELLKNKNLAQTEEGWARVALASARCRAKARGKPCTITVALLVSIRRAARGVCPVLGVPLIYRAANVPSPNSASIDCIDPSLGYIPGNVIIVSNRANRLKMDATPEELRLVADFAARIDVVAKKRRAELEIAQFLETA